MTRRMTLLVLALLGLMVLVVSVAPPRRGGERAQENHCAIPIGVTPLKIDAPCPAGPSGCSNPP